LPRARRIDIAAKANGNESVAEYFARSAKPSLSHRTAERVPAKSLALTFDGSVQSFKNTE
jgi:hypothetical protein